MVKFIVTVFELDDIVLVAKEQAAGILIAHDFFTLGSASSFSNEMIREATKIAHDNSLEVFVLCNRMLFDEDINPLKEYLSFLKEIDVDGIYYSDLAVLTIAKELDMVDKLVYSPGAVMTSTSEAREFITQGNRLVEIAPETTLEEKLLIINELKSAVTLTIHGRVRMFSSKRKLLSNYLEILESDFNPQNRKDLYLIESTRTDKMPVIETEDGTVIYSGYTLNSFNELKQLVNAGIEYVLIDGIFFDIDYVLAALNSYQSILKGSDSESIKENFISEYEDHTSTGFYYQKTNLVK